MNDKIKFLKEIKVINYLILLSIFNLCVRNLKIRFTDTDFYLAFIFETYLLNSFIILQNIF